MAMNLFPYAPYSISLLSHVLLTPNGIVLSLQVKQTKFGQEGQIRSGIQTNLSSIQPLLIA